MIWGNSTRGDWQFVQGRRRRVLFKFQPNLRPWDGEILAGVGAGRVGAGKGGIFIVQAQGHALKETHLDTTF